MFAKTETRLYRICRQPFDVNEAEAILRGAFDNCLRFIEYIALREWTEMICGSYHYRSEYSTAFPSTKAVGPVKKLDPLSYGVFFRCNPGQPTSQAGTKINVRDFIQKNYTPYDGDSSFLAGPTAATTKLWEECCELFKKERENGGVLDMDTKIVSTITSHGAGYIDKDLETIVGVQTDAPLKKITSTIWRYQNG